MSLEAECDRLSKHATVLREQRDKALKMFYDLEADQQAQSDYIVELRKAWAESEKDAGRYRWVNHNWLRIEGLMNTCAHGYQMTERVDEAMKEKPHD
jgi:hypothetical protein